MSNEALKRACGLAGGQKPLADRIGTTQSQVWYWLEKSKRGVPAEFVLPIERETGVPRSELRPDLWPVEVEESRA
jgi:DNA-binding transcriptional regulator YdaS (Cro superfamily)